MKGVKFLKDESSNKRYVQIELDTLERENHWEDLFDLITIELRRNEKSIPIEEVARKLQLKPRRRKYV